MTLKKNLAFLAAALKGTDAEPDADVARFARQHNVAEILDGLLEASPLRARVPAEALAAFRTARLMQAERSARLLAALGRITRGLKEAGIVCIAMKGLGLGARFYGGLDRRATRDLDLLVAEEDLPAAERVLRTLGFRRASIVPSRRLALRFTHAFDYVGDGLTVDLHWTLARHPSFRFDLPRLRGRRETRPIQGVDVDQLADDDALAFCALAVFRDVQRGALRARALVDLYRIAAACPKLDWGEFLARRRAEGTYRVTVNVLSLLLHALDARGALPAVAAAATAAGSDVRVDGPVALRLLDPSRFALGNRLFAIRLYDCSPVRSFLWWLLSMPVRVLAYRSWRLPRRGRRRR
ncbi:MAG: nucleotidyltransferase family protein [Planctomycetota bacterium]